MCLFSEFDEIFTPIAGVFSTKRINEGNHFLHYIMTGVAVGSGRQATVAYINIGCYYIIGLPVGILMGWVFHLGVMVRYMCLASEL